MRATRGGKNELTGRSFPKPKTVALTSSHRSLAASASPNSSFNQAEHLLSRSSSFGNASSLHAIEENSTSLISSMDILPDSATFFEELPLASNNDFDPAISVMGSRMATTSSTQTRGGFSSSSMPSMAGAELGSHTTDHPSFVFQTQNTPTRPYTRAMAYTSLIFEASMPLVVDDSTPHPNRVSASISTHTTTRPSPPTARVPPAARVAAQNQKTLPRRSARLSMTSR